MAAEKLDKNEDKGLGVKLPFDLEPLREIKSEEELLEYMQEDAAQIKNLIGCILTYVTRKKYITAIREMRNYESYKKRFPGFETRTASYFNYAEQLIKDIEEKIKTPNMRFLSTGKRHEIYESLQITYQQLKAILARIEQIDNDLKVDDTHSTIWVLRAFMFCSMAVWIVGALKEGSGEMDKPFMVLVDDIVKLVISFIF